MMSAPGAPTIPNLLSLRSHAASSSRGRARGRGHRHAPPAYQPVGRPPASQDDILQGTDNDAAVSRMSAVSLGYLDDPFACYFVGGTGPGRVDNISSGGGIPGSSPGPGTAAGAGGGAVPSSPPMGRGSGLGGEVTSPPTSYNLPFSSPPEPLAGPTRRLPIINRGTYVRTTAIDTLISKFLSSPSPPGQPGTDGDNKKQIISLGAGTDTRPFRMFTSLAGGQPQSTSIGCNNDSDHSSDTEVGGDGTAQEDSEGGEKNLPGTLLYHELDFPSMSVYKHNLIRSIPSLRAVVGHPELVSSAEPPAALSSWICRGGKLANGSVYTFTGMDLKDLAAISLPVSSTTNTTSEDSTPKISHPSTNPSLPTNPIPHFSPTAPTLILSECCLCYLPPSTVSSLLATLLSYLSPPPTSPLSPPTPTPASLILYEPIHPTTAFGRTMTSNLGSRGIIMPTLPLYPTPASQQQRLVEAGFLSGTGVKTVAGLWDEWVDGREKQRIEGLEGGLDEVEEWGLLGGHYVVAWGWRGEGNFGWDGMDSEAGG